MKKKLPLIVFSAIISLWGLICYNIPFFQYVTANNDADIWQQILLVGGLSIVMMALNFWACYLLVFLFRYIGRVLVAAVQIGNAAGVYFVVVYRTILDGPMMENFYNTRWSEASSFFTPVMLLWLIFAGLLPALWILIQRVEYGSWKRFGIVSGVAIGLSLLLAGANFNQFLWFGKHDTELGGLLMPWSYIVNSGRIYAQHRAANAKEEPLPDATLRPISQPTAVVLVIGESARKANFQLYGYERATNPLLSQRTDLHLLPARACATYTTAAVRAMMQYKSSSTLYEALPNYLFRHGVDVVWRTNNWGEPPMHIDEYVTLKELKQQYPEADDGHEGALFAGIKQRIEQSPIERVFIVLHTNTSHGAQYSSQYPASFRVFTPVAQNVEDGVKNIPGLMNAYDNTIVYTDYLLNELIDSLASIPTHRTAMIYMSDHGESLGENGLFMHGVPMRAAPKEQNEVPLIVWLSSEWRTIRQADEPYNSYVLYHSILDLLDIDSPIYEPQKDIFEYE
ncbi:MAG: sulfatase-like hydrolase/transferase [Paludibacteraceae bacterium]|nr:sulfatase-like hydrolase/transferase [Paludibacteraceae bacterium]